MADARQNLLSTVCPPTFIQTLPPGAECRMVAERFVAACFKRYYGAQIRHFMPLLLSLSDQHEELKAVLGFRYADHRPLFLEHYLKQPVEQVLSAKLKLPVDRSKLVEVGNLAAKTMGGGRWLITVLTAYLSATGAEWALFTIGPALQNAFTRMGLELVELAPAQRESLPLEEQSHWGRYYDQKPRVMAGNIAQGYAVLRSICLQDRPMRELWLSAERAGMQAA
jgi:hypothetical protein